MMRKLLAVLVVVAMMLSTVAFAAPSNLSGVITDLDRTPPIRRTLDVPVDMVVDAGQTGTFIDGPVNKTISGSSLKSNYKATIYMSEVRGLFTTLLTLARGYVAGETALENRVDKCIVKGDFTIKITYPGSAVVPEAVLNGTELDGFNAEAATTFVETERTVNDDLNEITIKISVKPGITAAMMEAQLENYLPDITFTCTGVTLAEGVNKVSGSISGTTKIYDDNEDPAEDDLICEINYVGKQGKESGVTGGAEISETVEISKEQGGGSPIHPQGGTGSLKPAKPPKVEVKIPSISGSETVKLPEGATTINVEKLEKDLNPTREGFVFAGFYADEFFTQKLEGEVPVNKDTTIYGRFINTTVPEIFDDENHIQYVYGYPDGTVKPEANVTREEITAMLYRLLKADVRTQLETTENEFTDISEDRWSNVAISSMTKGGYLYGCGDGLFNPEAEITRGELAAIVSRFVGRIVEGDRGFNDIDGHWAEESIKSVANNEWIFGYTDGSFKPDAKITRAEAIAIINRVVVRYVNHEGLTGAEKHWPDNDPSSWYYYPVVEATNHHDHQRDETKYNELWSAATAD